MGVYVGVGVGVIYHLIDEIIYFINVITSINLWDELINSCD